MTFVKNVWYVVAHAHEFDDDAMVSRTICNQSLLMYRTQDGRIAALDDRCPHRFVPLSMGKRTGDMVRCAYHGLAFGPEGDCVDAPNEDDGRADQICVKSFPAVERYSVIWLWLGDPELANPDTIPAFDFLSDPEHYAVARGYTHINANYEFLADNLLDLSHVHYLHPGVHGSDFNSFENKVKVEGDTVWSMLWRPHYKLDERRKAQMGFDVDEVEGQGHSRWNAPGVLLVDTAYWEHGKGIEDGLRSPSAHLLTPETEYSSHYFWASGRTNALDDERRTRLTEENMQRIFSTEDGPMCEAQQRALGENLDFLSAKPVILKADAAGLAARRIIKRKLRAEADVGEPGAPVAGERAKETA